MARRILQVVSSINQKTGGTARSVPALADAFGNEEFSSTLACLDYRKLGKKTPVQKTDSICIPASFLAEHLRGFSPTLARKIQSEASRSTLIHNHGLWMFPNLYAAQAATKCRIPLVISPRGMLEQWSLSKSSFKKRIVLSLFQSRMLREAKAFHATSRQEYESIRSQGLEQPVALIPNGVYSEEFSTPPSRDVLEALSPECSGKKILGFLSRIDEKKGLDILLKAFAESQCSEKWQLLIAGPDLRAYQAELEKLVTTLQLESSVSFLGMLEGEKRLALLAHSDCFVLPSHSENFGIVVAEALASGTPVAASAELPWEMLASEDCGFCVNNSVQGWREFLRELDEIPMKELSEKGVRGKKVVERDFSWKQIGESMRLFYRFLLDDSSCPEFVYCD